MLVTVVPVDQTRVARIGHMPDGKIIDTSSPPTVVMCSVCVPPVLTNDNEPDPAGRLAPSDGETTAAWFIR
jgi:hypothetical protein